MQLLDEILRDSFKYLSRWELDGAMISCQQFYSIIDDQMTRVCLRRLEQAGVTHNSTFLFSDERVAYTFNRIELTRPEDLGPYLRSTSVGCLGLSFHEPLKSESFSAVMDGLLVSAPTMVVDRLRFDYGAFSRADFAKITRLCRAFMSLNRLNFDGCYFPAESEQVCHLSAYANRRYIDDEVLELLRNVTSSLTDCSVTFVEARVSSTFVRKILESRTGLLEAFSLSITGEPQDGLEGYECFRERPGRCSKNETSYTFVELKLSVRFEADGSIYIASLSDWFINRSCDLGLG